MIILPPIDIRKLSEEEKIQRQFRDRKCRRCGGRMEKKSQDEHATQLQCASCSHKHAVIKPRWTPERIAEIRR